MWVRVWLGLGQCHEGLADRSFPVASVGIVRRVRRRVWIQPARRGRVWPIARQIVRLMLLQTGLLALLLGANRVPLSLFLLAELPFLRALLTLSVGLLRNLLLTSGVLAAAVAVPRPPKPAANGRVLDDGTYEVILGDQFAIRHKPVDEFDRRMFLLFLRTIHLVDRPSKWPFLCQSWLATWFGTLQELISRWEDYHEIGDWQRLMSRHTGPLLPWEQRQALITHAEHRRHYPDRPRKWPLNDPAGAPRTLPAQRGNVAPQGWLAGDPAFCPD